MGNLNPVLSSRITPEAPVSAPTQSVNIAGALGNLLTVGTNAFSRAPAREPSEGEKRDTALKPFVSRVNDILSSDMSSVQRRNAIQRVRLEVAVNHPSDFASFNKTLNDLGVASPIPEIAPQDVEIDVFNEVRKTPPGVLARERARAESTDSDGNVDERRADQLEREHIAEIIRDDARKQQSAEELKRLQDDEKRRDIVSERLWDEHKGTAVLMVDTATDAVGKALEELNLRGSFELTEDLAANLGLPAGKITRENAVVYLERYRSILKRQIRDSLLNSQGLSTKQLSPASEEYYNSVLRPLDQQIAIVRNNLGSAVDIINTTQARKEQEMYDSFPLVLQRWIGTINALPPEFRTEIFLNQLGNDPVMAAIAQVLNVTSIPEEGTREIVNDSSKEDVKKINSAVVENFSKGFENSESFRTNFMILDAASTRLGGSEGEGTYLSPDAFKTIYVKNSSFIKGESDPSVIEFYTDRLGSDLKNTLQNAQFELDRFNGRRANMGIVSFSITKEGTLEFTTNPPTVPMPFELEPRRLPEFEESLKEEFMQLPIMKALSQKLSALGGMGKVGEEVMGVLVSQAEGQVSTNPQDTPDRLDNFTPEVRRQLLEDFAREREGQQVANGPIAESLGLDFGGIEKEFGLPAGFLERTASIESAGNPSAKNPNSSAGGLFQQLDSNARQYGVTNKFDPLQSTRGAAKFAADNQKILRKALGREPTGGELYLAHQQGGAGAAKLLTNQDASAASIVGLEAVTLNGGSAKMSAGEFANIWISRYNSAPRATGRGPTGNRGPTSFTEATGETPKDVPQGTSEPVFTSTRTETVTQPSQGVPTAPQGTAEAPQGTPKGEGTVTASERVVQDDIEKLSEQSRGLLQRFKIDILGAPKFDTLAQAEEALRRGEVKKGDFVVINNEVERL